MTVPSQDRPWVFEEAADATAAAPATLSGWGSFVLLLGLPLVALAPVEGLSAQVPEIPDYSLPDIAMVRPDPQYGAVIIYNPTTCQLMGPACGFFRSHEYGHVFLGHQYLHPAAYPALREAQADCWAAQNGNPREILAGVQLFLNGGSSSNWQVYGNPLQRAQRVRACAIQVGKWLGD